MRGYVINVEDHLVEIGHELLPYLRKLRLTRVSPDNLPSYLHLDDLDLICDCESITSYTLTTNLASGIRLYYRIIKRPPKYTIRNILLENPIFISEDDEGNKLCLCISNDLISEVLTCKSKITEIYENLLS